MWDTTHRLLPDSSSTTLIVLVQIIKITASAATAISVQILNIFLVKIPSAHVLVGAAIATLTSGHTVALSPEIHPETPRCDLLGPLCRFLPSFDLLARLVEVLRSVVCRSKGRSIEIVEH